MRGLLLACLTVVCLAAGFVVFPGYVASCLWNRFLGFMPAINLFQGVMLWAIIALSCYIPACNRKKSFIALKSTAELNEDELMQVMNAIKRQHNKKHTPLIIKSEDLRHFELREITKPSDFEKKSQPKISDESKKKENV